MEQWPLRHFKTFGLYGRGRLADVTASYQEKYGCLQPSKRKCAGLADLNNQKYLRQGTRYADSRELDMYTNKNYYNQMFHHLQLRHASIVGSDPS